MLAYNQHRGEPHPGALALGKEEAPPARGVQTGGVSMNELYLKEDFPSFSDSYIHFAGSLISSESGLKSTVSRGISKVLP